MNSNRIVLGGAVAGAAIAASGFALAGIINASVPEASNDATPLAVQLLRSFFLGMGSVLLYALIRPRLGAGPGTAATAGLLVFLIGVLFPPFAIAMNGSYPPRALLISIIWGAVQLPIAAMIGSAIYSEKQSA